VIFTASLPEYADYILNKLDPHNTLIGSRLYRYHTFIDKDAYIKDLKKLGRDLSKTLIVDNVAENFRLQPENGIFIKTWTGDPKDTVLMELGAVLEKIAQQNV
jgi:CTD small phosphatase-like protein 2